MEIIYRYRKLLLDFLLMSDSKNHLVLLLLASSLLAITYKDDPSVIRYILKDLKSVSPEAASTIAKILLSLELEDKVNE